MNELSTTTTATTTTAITTATTITSTTAFDEAMGALQRSLDSQVLVSQDRCVDGLLDLYNTAPNGLVRQLVVDILDDIRHLSAVRAAPVRARLTELTAAVSVELAFSA